MSRFFIQISHISKSFGPKPLFEDISLGINQGEIYALIGENGSGKTTLLNFLTGAVLPDSGQVIREPSLSVGFLPQEMVGGTGSVRNYLAGTLWELEQRMAESWPATGWRSGKPCTRSMKDREGIEEFRSKKWPWA